MTVHQTDPTNVIVKYADDAVVGLISDADETAYRAELENLKLNVLKTKGLIMDRRHRQVHSPLIINGEQLELFSWAPTSLLISPGPSPPAWVFGIQGP